VCLSVPHHRLTNVSSTRILLFLLLCLIVYQQDVVVRLDSETHRFEQRNPPNWGLDRIDDLAAGDKVKALDASYKFDQTGDGVVVFVVDTGIHLLHMDFSDRESNSRISCGYDSYHWHHHEGIMMSGWYVRAELTSRTQETTDPSCCFLLFLLATYLFLLCFSFTPFPHLPVVMVSVMGTCGNEPQTRETTHSGAQLTVSPPLFSHKSTHVAGIVGGLVYGVAKEVMMVSVKVFNDAGAGSIGSVLSGLDFILRTREQNADFGPMVVNMAWGTEADSIPLELTIAAMAKTGLILTASAGNEGRDACTKSPAKFEEVITVGATTVEDVIATFSNKGKCVDIFAPGDRITSDWSGNEFDRATISGTSAASAHAAGVAALVLQTNPQMQPGEMKNALMLHSEINAVQGFADDDYDTPNLLLNMALLSV